MSYFSCFRLLCADLFKMYKASKPSLRPRPWRKLNLSVNGEPEAPIVSNSAGLDEESETPISNTQTEPMVQEELSLQGEEESAEEAPVATGQPGSHSTSLLQPRTPRVSMETGVKLRANRQRHRVTEPRPGTSGEHLDGPTVSQRDQEPNHAEFEEKFRL